MFNQNEDNDKENGHHDDGGDDDDQEQVGDEVDRVQDVAFWQGYHITPHLPHPSIPTSQEWMDRGR